MADYDELGLCAYLGAAVALGLFTAALVIGSAVRVVEAVRRG